MKNETTISKAVKVSGQESLEAFARRVGDAISKKFGVRPAPGKNNGVYCWTRAIYPDKVVFQKMFDAQIGGNNGALFSVGFTSTPDSISFDSEPVVVREVITYEPVNGESKSLTIKSIDFWNGLNL